MGDNHSIDNAIIALNSPKWPLLVDPQSYGREWLKSHISTINGQIFKNFDLQKLKGLENCITNGIPIFIEDFQASYNPILTPLLFKQEFKSKGVITVKLSDK